MLLWIGAKLTQLTTKVNEVPMCDYTNNIVKSISNSTEKKITDTQK